ncbi:MAG: bifunctional 2',3'-cyclic-nucleotide 2'-phosphodiesterase/3'-nucleotidase [Alphaproteobacteria bacterium]
MLRAPYPTSDSPVFQSAAEESQFFLRILATTDLHIHLTPWDYYADRSSAVAGLARTATLIAKARAEVQASLLLDNGDFLQGSPLGDVVFNGKTDNEIHPMIAAMNALGYDAATLGNHEFSNGLPFLMQQLRMARFPVVSANIARRLGPSPLQDLTLVPPSVILKRRLTNRRGVSAVLRIGVIGLTPPQTTLWDRQHLHGLVVARDIVEAAAAHVTKLRAQGADVVIALSHSGIGAAQVRDPMDEATTAVAAIPGVDAVIAGHTHQTFPSPDFSPTAEIDPVRGLLCGKPAVMPGFHGSHLGLIDLCLSRTAGKWQLLGGQSALRPIARRTRNGRLQSVTKSAPDILAIAHTAHRATRRWAVTPLGQSTSTLHSYFALVAPCPTVRLISRAQAERVAQRLADGPYAGLPVLSAAAPFHAGGRGGPENYTAIPPGTLVMRHAFALYPQPNTLTALLITGADLTQWLERSFSLFNHISPGATDAELIDPRFACYNFDLIEGLDWQVDLSAPPRYNHLGRVIDTMAEIGNARRIHNVTHDGRPIDPDARFVLATNSYRAAGSGGFPGSGPDRIILSGPEGSRNIPLAHIARLGTIPAPAQPNWRFAPMPGTSVLFSGAPAAAAHLSDLSPLQAEALDLLQTGFRRFRLHL